MKALWGSWKTSAMGVLVLLCGGADYAQVFPDKYASLLHLLCGVAVAFGLISAKDGDKSNAPIPSPDVVKVS